jgi:hypothetical protein
MSLCVKHLNLEVRMASHTESDPLRQPCDIGRAKNQIGGCRLKCWIHSTRAHYAQTCHVPCKPQLIRGQECRSDDMSRSCILLTCSRCLKVLMHTDEL